VIDAVLTPARILAAAEDVLRRYGPGKATVVDVAQALGVSHGSVYRHFPSKAALRDAVLRGWLDRGFGSLEGIAGGKAAAPTRLRQWLAALRDGKRKKAHSDPELFATYAALAADAREVIGEHVEHLQQQLQRIVADGVHSGHFRKVDPVATALAIFDATLRFHHPAMAYKWNEADDEQAFDSLITLLLHGLAQPAPAAGKKSVVPKRQPPR